MRSNPKRARPLSTKESVHLILKSDLAIGKKSLLHPTNAKVVDALIRRQAKKFGVRLFQLVNVGNHLHLILQLPQIALPAARKAYFAFVRSVTGLIARHVLSAEKGSPKHARFWAARPFTRLVSWGRDFKRLCRYLEKNAGQALGLTIDCGFDLATSTNSRPTNSTSVISPSVTTTSTNARPPSTRDRRLNVRPLASPVVG